MKTKIMVIVLTYFSNILLLQAQVTDNFNDGDFIANPAWTGDSNQFIVSNGQLQLNSSGSDSSYLVTPYFANAGTREWDFKLKLNFAPSSSNYARIYLSANQQNLERPLNGYFLQFGESGSNDAIELFRQTGSQLISIGRGINGTLANGFFVSVKVKRDSTGNWIVFSDYNAGTNFSQEFTGADNSFFTGGFFGLRCNYTSGNSTKFYFDDFYSGPEVFDLTPPALLNLLVIDSMHLDLYFDEPIDSMSPMQNLNYYISPLIGNPVSVTSDSADPLLIHLEFNSKFTNGTGYTILLNGVMDLAKNVLENYNFSFQYIKTERAIPADLIITEIMANPDGSPALPSVEYIEIYNRSNKYISTHNWKISDGSTTGSLSDDTVAPDNYRIYCSTANVSIFKFLGVNNAKAVVSFPGLNNDGDEIIITDDNNIIIDRANYNPEWFHDEIKSKGGWSIERIDENFTCDNPLNWKASIDLRGGSPGIKNSVSGTFSDHNSPYLIHASVIDSIHIRLHFNEAVDIINSKNIKQYAIENYNGIITDAFADSPEYNTVNITLSSALIYHTIYKISVASTFTDCAGNFIDEYTSVDFGLADPVEPGDIIINEILFNPKPDENDFVELYNRSGKIIDLHNLKIANADILTGETQTYYPLINENRLLMPGNYIALTENSNSLENNFRILNKRNLLQSSLPSYNDDEGIVQLFTASLGLLDQFHYNEKMHFALLNDVEGISLERINPYAETNKNDNWHSASQTSGFATPGYQNSQYFESTGTTSILNIEPELFSPDNDGKNDVINFELTLEKSGYYASISIFNSEGIEIKKLVSNELCGTKSSWTWNGFTNDDHLAPIGIYVIYLRLINADGDIKYEKHPCVLAHKI